MIVSNRDTFACEGAQRDPVKDVFDKEYDAAASPAQFLFEYEEPLKVIRRKRTGGDTM